MPNARTCTVAAQIKGVRLGPTSALSRQRRDVLGLRVSEIVGLKWGDLDWELLQASVRRSVVLGSEGEVKTVYSGRQMPLDAGLAVATSKRTQPNLTHRIGSSPIRKQASPGGLTKFNSSTSARPE
jgi:integrase